MLDDIITGNEPNFIGEFVILAVSVPVFAFAYKWGFGENGR